MQPIGSQAGSQAIIDARVLTQAWLRPPIRCEALAHYDAVRRPVMNEITLRNRQFGPEAAMQIVEERAPNGFARIEDVISREEMETISRSFHAAAGLDANTVNTDRRSCAPHRGRDEAIKPPHRCAAARSRRVHAELVRRISSVCSPSSGGARRTEAGVSENLNGMPSSRAGRPAGCSTVSIIWRAAVCGSSSACATVLMRPHGMPAAFSLASQASAPCRRRAPALIASSTVVAVDHAVAVRGEARILGPLGMAEHVGEAGELRIVADADRDHGVGGAIGRVGHDARMAVAEAAAVLAGDAGSSTPRWRA